MPNENPPADAGKATPPAGTSVTTPPPAATVIDHEEGNEIMDNLTPDGRRYIKQLRGEAKEHRLEKSQYKDRAEIAEQKLKAVEAEREAAERERLEKQQEYQKLYDTEKAGRQSDRQKLIDAEIRVLAIKNSVPEKVAQKLLDKTGISIDGDGNISGMDRAWQRMQEEHEDIFEAMRKPAAGSKSEDDDDQEDGAKAKKGKGDDKKINDGENYGKRRAGAGGDPPPSGGKKQTVNARGMKPQEAESAYAEWKRKHSPARR